VNAETAAMLETLAVETRDRVYEVMGIRPTHPYGTLIAERIRAALASACEAQRAADAEICRQYQRENPECPETAEYCAEAIEGKP